MVRWIQKPCVARFPRSCRRRRGKRVLPKKAGAAGLHAVAAVYSPPVIANAFTGLSSHA